METAKNGFQKFQDVKNSLIVLVLGLVSQLFSIANLLNCLPAKLVKESCESH